LTRPGPVLEGLLARPPTPGTDLLGPQIALARVCYNQAMRDRGNYSRWEQTAAAFRKAREVCDRVLAVRPAHVELLLLRGVSCYNLALLPVTPGAESRQSYEQARATFETLVRLQPGNAEARGYLARTLSALGARAASRGQRAEALVLFRNAIEHQSKVHAADKTVEQRRELAALYRLLGGVLCDLKQPAEAAAATLECAKLYRGEAVQLYGDALDLARCIPLVGEGAETLTPAQQAERGRHADLALAELRAAVAAGYANERRLRTDPEWEPLRDRAELGDLLRQVQARAKRGK
jgi:tetratricopeptide (TPR) repeat protein